MTNRSLAVVRRQFGALCLGAVVIAGLSACDRSADQGLALGSVNPQRLSSAHSSGPLRIMLFGDSITQGSSGDWTWRYRLWQHLTDASVDVDLVGPRNDLFDNVRGRMGTHAYLDPDFDTDHAARWGATLWSRVPQVATMVGRFQPDVLVVLAGINDLTWSGRSPEQTLAVLRQVITDARLTHPGIAVVLVHPPHHWLPQVAAYTPWVDALALELDQPDARVVAAATGADFEPRRSTWDGLHPNAQGEAVIAAAVADALSGLGIGPPATRPLAEVALGPRVPPGVRARVHGRRVVLRWWGVPGATGVRVWVKPPDGVWHRFADSAGREQIRLPGLAPGRYGFRLRPVKGSVAGRRDVSSRTVWASVGGQR